MPSKIREKATRLAWLVRAGRLPQAVGFASQFLLGRSLYLKHLSTYFRGDLPVDVDGNVMYLSPTDPGVSSELFHFGTRERMVTGALQRELRRLGETDSESVVIDIGAHRGYYTFQAADVLGDGGTVYAFEPDPENFEALCRGIETNGFENVRAERRAIGGEDTIDTLKTARQSNSHTLRSPSAATADKYAGETVETDVSRLDTYLDECGLDPADVDLVKIDVEGYETKAFEGMGPLLEADSDLLIVVELHPHRVEPSELQSVINKIESAGFELVHAGSSAESNLYDFDAVRRHVGVRTGRHTVDLIAKRRGVAPADSSTSDAPARDSRRVDPVDGIDRGRDQRTKR